jgi:hypothetical protein
MRLRVDLRIPPQLQRQLQSTLHDKIKEIAKREIISTALSDIETPAKQNCRVDTGRLRASIHTAYKGHRENYIYTDNHGTRFESRFGVTFLDTRTFTDVFVGTDVNYAKKIERLYPYLNPAFQAAKRNIPNNIKRAIMRELWR